MKVFWKKVKSAGFKKKLSELMRLEEAVVEQNIRKKRKSECFAWDFFKRYIVKNDGEDQVLDVFALAIYGLVIFPKVPGHVDVTPQIRDVTGQRQTYTYASEALTYRTSGMTFPL